MNPQTKLFPSRQRIPPRDSTIELSPADVVGWAKQQGVSITYDRASSLLSDYEVEIMDVLWEAVDKYLPEYGTKI